MRIPLAVLRKEAAVRRGAIRCVRGYTQQDAAMPWRGYIIWAGGALLALLFAIDGLTPRTASSEPSRAAVELPPIRIRSEAKGPEAVVIDTSRAALLAASDQELAVSEPIEAPRQLGERFGYAACEWCRVPSPGQAF